jgi:hypothetical protein
MLPELTAFADSDTFDDSETSAFAESSTCDASDTSNECAEYDILDR